ncbi:MAG: hypothetical protein COS68_08030 [Elusimicrobia bacterium CG06_land_8_20_14_3_00_38_11]|nr:MAG: hypothetical protein COS68_08030 [Elusimicrobia bacterium CG06_land_8_20_14_3_00_38_11]
MKKPRIREKILRFIRKSKIRRGFPPTEREIAGYMGFASSSTVHYHLNQLVKKGLLKFRYKKIN